MSLWQKYRPGLDGIKGNDKLIASLRKMFSNPEHPHAFLVTGQPGGGKTSISRAIAVELLESKVVIENDNGNDRGKEAMSALAADMALRPILGKTKVCILDEAHKLTPDAKSALLKPVEEAAPWAYYFFCTPEPDKLFQGKDGEALKTRLTPLKLKKPSNEEIANIMRDVMAKEGFSITKSVGDAILKECGGAPREALKLLEQARFGGVEAGGDEDTAQAQIIDLCRALLKTYGNRKHWGEVAEILVQLKDAGTDAETVRRAVMGYAQAILLKGLPDVKALDILDLFSAPIYDGGFPKLTLAAVKVCYCTLPPPQPSKGAVAHGDV